MISPVRAILFAALLSGSAAVAADGPFGGFRHDETQPIEIAADSLEVQEADSLAITPGIAVDLFTPEFLPGLRPAEQWAVMPVPEAPMHEDHRMIFWQNKVRSTGKAPAL